MNPEKLSFNPEQIKPNDHPEEQPQETDDYAILTNEEERARIGKEMAKFINTIVREQPDVLVFLDRSARPAAWLFRHIWGKLYPNQAPPEIKFVNIGREKFNDQFAGRHEPQRVQEQFRDRLKSNQRRVDEVRDTFSVGRGDPTLDLPNDVTYFDGKKIWIVDEYSPEGGSLMTAQALFEGAFGFRTPSRIETKVLFSEEPSWLNDEELMGIYEHREKDLHVRPIQPRPEVADQFRRDINKLADAIAANQELKFEDKEISINPGF